MSAPLPPHPWVDAFLAFLEEVRGFSPDTVVTYRKALLDFRRRMGIEEFSSVTLADADRYMGRLVLGGLARNTRRGRMTALRTFFAFLVSRGYLPTNPLKDAETPPERRSDRIPIFSMDEIKALIFTEEPLLPRQRREPAQNFRRRSRTHALKQTRDTALLALMYGYALRASEPGRLLRTDYRMHPGRTPIPILVLRESKRSTEPTTFRLDRSIAALLDSYLLALEGAGITHPALFPPLAYRRRSSENGVGADQVAHILQARVKVAGIVARERHLSPHVLRYSRATHLRTFLNIEEIQSLLRHRSIATTLRYIRLGSVANTQRRANAILPWTPGPWTTPLMKNLLELVPKGDLPEPKLLLPPGRPLASRKPD